MCFIIHNTKILLLYCSICDQPVIDDILIVMWKDMICFRLRVREKTALGVQRDAAMGGAGKHFVWKFNFFMTPHDWSLIGQSVSRLIGLSSFPKRAGSYTSIEALVNIEYRDLSKK